MRVVHRSVCSYKAIYAKISIVTKRKVILISLLYLLGLVIAVTIVHETAHFVAALSIGVPFSEIAFSFDGINPSLTIPERFASSNLSILHYAGGLIPAVILTFIYLLHWYRRFRREPSLMNWTMGLITIVAAGFQLAQGYNEGRFHAAYIYYSDSLLNILNIPIYLLVIAAILIHFTLCPRSKMKKV